MYKKVLRWLASVLLIGGSFAVFAQSEAQIFTDRVMVLLPAGDALEMLKSQQRAGKLQPESYYEFGKGICDGLARGMDRRQILEESLYHFWGKELSDAMYQAALDTVCPQLKQ